MRGILVILTILSLNIIHSTPNFGSLKTLRERTKNMKDNIKVVTDSKRGASMKFTPKTDFLYPGLDKRKIEKVKRLWKDYYDCQQALYDAALRLVVPEALAFLEGSNAVLECEVCESPRDLFTPTKWFYSAQYGMSTVSEIKETPNIFMKNDSLHIFNIGDSRGGLYMCKKGPHSARPYILHIFGKEKTRRVVPEHNKEGLHAAPDALIPELNATVMTSWSEWTQCSRCDYIGKRYRTGICTIIANKNLSGLRKKRRTYLPNVITRFPPELSNNTPPVEASMAVTETQKYQQVEKGPVATSIEMSADTTTAPMNNTSQYGFSHKPENETTLTPETARNLSIKTDLEILAMFEDGIPCRSQMLSENTRRIATIENRSSEIMEAYCKLACPKSLLFVVVDEKGEVMETANNSEGIYSVRQGLPQYTPPISRVVQFAKYGKYFKFQCPGNRNGDIPVEWYVGQKLLTNILLEKETHGRVKIDEYNRIIIDPVLYEDSRVFSCWQRKELVGTVRLLVEKEHFILNFESPVTVIGTIIIFTTFFWVYYKAFTIS